MNNKKKPPRLAEWILHFISKPEERFSVIGDFEEIYGEIAIEGGITKAQYWYWFQIIKSAPLFLVNYIYWSAAMFKSYFKTTVRNLLKNKVFSLINISGLAVGMACCILIMLYILDELSFDRFHKNSDRIYRLNSEFDIASETTKTEFTYVPIDYSVFSELPEVEKVVYMEQHRGMVTRYEDKQFAENPLYVNPAFFEVFDFQLLIGNPETALSEPNSAVVTLEFAEKYFGDDDPVGKVLAYNNEAEYKITGIIKEIPRNSYLRADFIVSISTLIQDNTSSRIACNVHLLLHEGAIPKDLEAKIPDFLTKHLGEGSLGRDKYSLQPLTDIYLKSDFEFYDGEQSDIRYSYLLGVIALIIALIACINFINLSTARSDTRAKEVGMRKLVGAHRSQLMKQFLGESLILSLISIIFALVLARTLLPYFNSISGKELTLNFSENLYLLVCLAGLALFIGLLSGSYPAVYLSSLHPVEVITGDLRRRTSAVFMRKGLVVFQFALSLFFIISTLIVVRQMDFVHRKDLGFNAEQIVIVPHFKNRSIRLERLETMKNEFLKDPNVLDVSAAYSIPGYVAPPNNVTPEGFPQGETIHANYTPVDQDFFTTLGVEIIEGRGFSSSAIRDTVTSVIINETAVKKFGWDDPLGKLIKIDYGSGRGISTASVIGVVNDFHFESLHKQIEPHIFYDLRGLSIRFMLRIRLDNIPSTLEHLKKTWNQFSSGYIFNYYFLDETFDKFYLKEQKTRQIFMYASIFSIFIACLGLFGLAAFAAERRTKEIGIRKALGATVPGIVMLLSKDFAKLVLAANVIAWPIAYLIMDRWLQNFAYKANFGWWVFILAGILTLAIALITISYQSIKAATANPVDSLRYE